MDVLYCLCELIDKLQVDATVLRRGMILKANRSDKVEVFRIVICQWVLLGDSEAVEIRGNWKCLYKILKIIRGIFRYFNWRRGV